MASLGNLNVRIGMVGTRAFGRSSRTVVRSLGKITRGVKSLTKVFTKFRVAVVAVGAALGIHLINKSLKAIDAIAKTSDALSIQTEKLQALQHNAQLTGTSAEELNKSLSRMSRRLGEVKRIGGQAEFAMKDLGININNIVKLSPDKQFEALASAITKVENQAVRASLANDIFGRSGLKVLRLMELMKTRGLAPAVEELKALGVSFSRLDAAKVEAANDAWLRFSQALTGIVNQLTIKLAPIMTGVINIFIEWIKQSGGVKKIMGSLVKSLISGFATVADVLTVVGRILKGVATATFSFFTLVGDSIGFLLEKFGVLKETMEGLSFGALFENLPGEKIEAFVLQVEAAAEKAAMAVAKASETRINTNTSFTSSFFSEEAEANRKRLEAFKESLLEGEDAENQAYQRRLEKLAEFIQQGTLKGQEALNLRFTLEKDHQKKITDLQRQEFEKRKDLLANTLTSQVSNIAQGFKLMTGAIGKESKRAFEITKVASIATAIIKGLEATVSAYATGERTGIPGAGIAFAATAAAATAAQISKIKSQSFGGSGSPSVGGGGGSSASVAPQQETGNRSFFIEGIDSNKNFTGEQVLQLIEEINESVGDGVKLIASGIQQ